MLAHGATPEISVKGDGGPGGGLAAGPTVLPPAVLAVCVPWPLLSTGLGPLHNPFTSVLEQSRKLSSLCGWVVPWPQSGSSAKEGCAGSTPVSSMAITIPSPLVAELTGGTAVPSQMWSAPINAGLR